MARRSQWGRNLDADDLEHHRMPDSFCGGELHAPGHIRHRTYDLAVDEVPETAHAHQKRTSDDDGIEEFEQVFSIEQCEGDYGYGRSNQDSVRRQAAQPTGGNQCRVRLVERPLVERHFNESGPEQNTRHDEESQGVDLTGREFESCVQALTKS